jgi:hypothetical protein
MNVNGYRAFLKGTATDLPCRGYSLKFQRRDAVESRRRATGVMTPPPGMTGVDEAQHGPEY